MLTHPTKEYVKSQKTIFDVAHLTRKKQLVKIGRNIVKGDERIDTFYDEFKQLHRVFYKPLSSVDWSLVIVSADEISFTTSNDLRRKLIHCTLAAILLLILLSLTIFGCLQYGSAKWWFVSVLASIFILSGIGVLWGLDLMSLGLITKEGELVSTSIELNRFLDLHRRLNIRLYRTNPAIVPTGLFISSINITSGSNLTVNGYVWQKYIKKDDETFGQELRILNAEKNFFEKVYERQEGLIKTIGWRFKAILKANFDYFKYPLDRQWIRLTIGPKNLDDNVILVPDFDSYQVTAKLHKELDIDVVMNQWRIQRTYFFYQLSDLSTNFGISNYVKQKNFPVLNFAVDIRRYFLSPIVSGLVPIVIIVAILFFMILIMTAGKKGDAGGVLRLGSSLFFTTALAHLAFRGVLPLVSITYLEYFYFLLYALVLLAVINCLLYTNDVPIRFIQYKDNFLGKLLFWPIVLSLFLIITLVFFY